MVARTTPTGRTMTDSDRSDTVEVDSHHQVNILTSEDEWETVYACEITEDDINEDGTITTPVSGECACRQGLAFNSISTDTIHLPEDSDEYLGEIVGAVPIGVLEDLAQRRR